jgi:hypothetical protein
MVNFCSKQPCSDQFQPNERKNSGFKTYVLQAVRLVKIINCAPFQPVESIENTRKLFPSLKFHPGVSLIKNKIICFGCGALERNFFYFTVHK